MIGSLMYLTASRPDIQFLTCLCTRYQANSKEYHLIVVKRIFIYLKGTPSLGPWYPKCSGFDLKGYSDSDYDGCNIDNKSTLGAFAAGCCANILCMKSQLSDYDIVLEKLPIFCDNTSAITLSNNSVLFVETLSCYTCSDSLLLTPLCCDDIHDVTPRVSALAGCDNIGGSRGSSEVGVGAAEEGKVIFLVFQRQGRERDSRNAALAGPNNSKKEGGGMKCPCQSSQIVIEDLLQGFWQNITKSLRDAIGYEYVLSSSNGWTNYHSSIQCALFEALYGKKRRSPILWVEIRESGLIGPELVQETTDKVVLIKEKLKVARDCQKSYVGY
ncbi:hypothetical protein Tco_1438251 [Tanacetum coccineum]